MLEKMARSLCKAAGHDPDGRLAPGLRPSWERYTDAARAGLEAIREPGPRLTEHIFDDRDGFVNRLDIVKSWRVGIDAIREGQA